MLWIGYAEELLYEIVQVCTMLMELLGICVLVSTAARCLDQASGGNPSDAGTGDRAGAGI